MAKITYVLYDIVYDLEDLDNEDKDLESTLPKELEFDISDGDSNVQYEGADWISDKVGNVYDVVKDEEMAIKAMHVAELEIINNSK
jgi:hypothetical protein